MDNQLLAEVICPRREFHGKLPDNGRSAMVLKRFDIDVCASIGHSKLAQIGPCVLHLRNLGAANFSRRVRPRPGRAGHTHKREREKTVGSLATRKL